MSNKTSDKNVATEEDIKVLKNIEKLRRIEFKHCVTDRELKALEHILSEREQKDKRIQELEHHLQNYVNGEVYSAKQLKNLASNQKKYFINKKILKDKLEEYKARKNEYDKKLQEPFANSYYKLKSLELSHKIDVIEEILKEVEK